MIYLFPIVLIMIALFLIRGNFGEASPSLILIGLIVAGIGIVLLAWFALRDGYLGWFF